MAFPDVRVLAGDRFQPAADASYRNLVWENIGLSGVVKKNTEIGTIPSWGPLYRISFDLKVNSLSRTVWTNVISFRGNGAKNNHGNLGDRIPAVFMHSNGRLHFSSSVGAKPSYNANSPVPLKKWLYVIIEQYPLNGKVKVKYLLFYLMQYQVCIVKGLFHCNNRWEKARQRGK